MSFLKYLNVVIIIIAHGKEITIPSTPNKIPPAKTEIITTNGCTLLVLPYTNGLII